MHRTYADLVQDDGVNIVYVAELHPFHRPLPLLAIAAGEHVLVEKLLAVHAIEAEHNARAP